MKKNSSLDYIFAVSKIRVLEKHLMKQEVFQEAIDSGLMESLRIFVEAGLYNEELLRIKNSPHLEEMLAKEESDLKKLISSLIPDQKLLTVLKSDGLETLIKIFTGYRYTFISDYLMHLADMHNIKTFLRLYILKEPEKMLNAKLVSGGFLKTKDLFKLYTQDPLAFITRLEYVHKHQKLIDYAFYFKDAILKTLEDKSFVYLEKEINDFLIKVLKPAKYINFGPEPVFAYYFAKINEINLMRMVILAKLNNVAPGLIKERLNDVYN